jgi:hypothetical protein
MVNHMLHTFTNTQKQLITNLHADFKRVMTQATSQLTADFLTHIDQLTERTNDLAHNLADHQQTQAATDKRADKQIAHLNVIQMDNTKHIKALQQENAAIWHRSAPSTACRRPRLLPTATTWHQSTLNAPCDLHQTLSARH